jgi:hypothetical protein
MTFELTSEELNTIKFALEHVAYQNAALARELDLAGTGGAAGLIESGRRLVALSERLQRDAVAQRYQDRHGPDQQDS